MSHLTPDRLLEEDQAFGTCRWPADPSQCSPTAHPKLETLAEITCKYLCNEVLASQPFKKSSQEALLKKAFGARGYRGFGLLACACCILRQAWGVEGRLPFCKRREATCLESLPWVSDPARLPTKPVSATYWPDGLDLLRYVDVANFSLSQPSGTGEIIFRGLRPGAATGCRMPAHVRRYFQKCLLTVGHAQWFRA